MPKLKIPEVRLAEFQVVLQGQAGGTIIILKIDPKTGKIVIEKIPDPRLELEGIMRVLTAASQLESGIASQVAQAIHPALVQRLRGATKGG